MMDRRRGGMRRKKVCQFCADKTEVIDYKDTENSRSISLKEVKFCLRESLELALYIREKLPLQSKEQESLHYCLTLQTNLKTMIKEPFRLLFYCEFS